VLVQVMSMMEIGRSAFDLKNTRQARIEKADLTGLGGVEDGAGGEPGEKIPNYPRSMLSFELSDGAVSFEAMEYRSIPDIQLGVTKLGYKMLLKDVFFRRGIGFLEPKTIVLKGFETEELEVNKDADFLRALDARMGKKHAELNPPQAAPAPQPVRPVPVADAPRAQNTPPDPVPQRTVQPYIESPFFTNPAQPVASASKHAALACERFLSPPRSSAFVAPAADGDSFEVNEELLREDPSTDFGEDMELDDEVLEQIDLAEKVALQDKGKARYKGKEEPKVDTCTSTKSEPSSSLGSRMSVYGSGKTSTVASGSTTTRSSKSKDPPTGEVINIDEDDDFESMYCSLDEAGENIRPAQRKKDRLPPESEIILISDSE